MNTIEIPHRDSLQFGLPSLPSFIKEIYPHQWKAVQEIMAAYENGAEVVWLSAPTGSGKTIIAELVRRMLRTRSVYTCTTKALQDQVANDFPYAKVLKGRSNYESLTPAVSASECDKTGKNCSWCPEVADCPYEVAKDNALGADLCVTNVVYLLYESNFVGKFKDCDFVVMDEGDTVEGHLMDFVQFELSKSMLKKLGLDAPTKGTHMRTISHWMSSVLVPALERKVKVARDPLEKVEYWRAKSRALSVAKEMLAGGWVRVYGLSPLVLKPITVEKHGDLLWEHGKKWLVMSATLIAPDVLAESTGLKRKYAIVNVPSTFPVENRRIHVAPVADMRSTVKAIEWPKMAKAVAGVLAKHPNDRIVVHTVNYELTRLIVDYLGKVNGHRPVFSYFRAADKDKAIAHYRFAPKAVLVGPSVERGLDLPDEECRVVVVAKIPWAALGDAQVKARKNMPGKGPNWYCSLAIGRLVQMTGRATRHATDWSVSYLLDSNFDDLFQTKRSHFPLWWAEAVDHNIDTRELFDAS